MVARRLIALLVVLLAFSVVLAALAPPRNESVPPTPQTDQTEPGHHASGPDGGDEPPSSVQGGEQRDLEVRTKTRRDGKLVAVEIEVSLPPAQSHDNQTQSARPIAQITAHVGEELSLEVSSELAGLVSVEELEASEFTTADSTARFDRLLQLPGKLIVTLSDPDQDPKLAYELARITVRPAKPAGGRNRSTPPSDGGPRSRGAEPPSAAKRNRGRPNERTRSPKNRARRPSAVPAAA